MELKWNPEIGMSAVIGLIGSLSILITLGIIYGKMDSKLETAASTATEAKAAALVNQHDTAAQAERLGRVETAVTFLVPSIQRIEAKLEKPTFDAWPPYPASPSASTNTPNR